MKYFVLYSSFVLSLIAISLLSCNDNDDNENLICYAFDERQCGVDAFADPGLAALTEEEKTNYLVKYLESQNIEIEEAKTVDNFYDSVCEACEVCPEVYRFFVQIEEDELDKLTALNLFNLKEIDCSEF